MYSKQIKWNKMFILLEHSLNVLFICVGVDHTTQQSVFFFRYQHSHMGFL